MTSRSSTVPFDWTCPCGQLQRDNIWIVVFGHDRDALSESLAGITHVVCNRCGQSLDLAQPLALIEVHPIVPVLLVYDSPNQLGDLEDRLWRAGPGASPRRPPPPGFVLTLERTLIPAVLAHRELLSTQPPDAAEVRFAQAVERARLDQQYFEALQSLLTVDSVDRLSEVLTERPELTDSGIISYYSSWREWWGPGPEDEPLFGAIRSLLDEIASGSDAGALWSQWERNIRGFAAGSLGPRLDALLERIDALPSDTLHAETLELYTETANLAESVGETDLAIDLRLRLGHLVAESAQATGGLGAQDGAAALEWVRMKTAALQDERFVRATTNLGVIYYSSPGVDRQISYARSKELIEALLPIISANNSDDADEIWARNATNLSLVYLVLDGNTRNNVRRARQLCREALAKRSLLKDRMNWAMSAANLGNALLQSEGVPPRRSDLRNAEEAIELFTASLEVFAANGSQSREAFAHHKMAQAYLQKATTRRHLARIDRASKTRPRVERLWYRLPGGRAELEQLLHVAALYEVNEYFHVPGLSADWAQTVLRYDLTDDDRHDLEAGTVAVESAIAGRRAEPVQLAQSHELAADIAEFPDDDRNKSTVLTHVRTALDCLKSSSMHQETLRVSWRLASLYQRDEKWLEALDAYKISIGSYSAIQEDSNDHRPDLSDYSTLFRWAAWSALQSGQTDEAAAILELGRVRIAAAQLHLQETLSERYSTPDSYGSPAARPGRVADDQRKEDSAEGPPCTDDATQLRTTRAIWQKVADITSPQHALVYVFATPHGSSALLIESSGDQESAPRAREIVRSGLNSKQMVLMLLGPIDDQMGLLGARWSHNDSILESAITSVSTVLGRELARPLVQQLTRRGYESFSIVASGLLGMFPWSAAFESSPDDLGVPYSMSPSASTLLSSARRSRRMVGRKPILVGLANPARHDLESLRWSELELDAIKATVVSRKGTVFSGVGVSASSAFLRKHGADGTHIHLACHGSSNLLKPLESYLALADQNYAVKDILASLQLDARLVVLSACETAHFDVFSAPDELEGLPMAMLAAGSAAVIASLWPVDDRATALLMARFYEEIADPGAGEVPSAVLKALRNAQNWLRTLTYSSECEYIAEMSPTSLDPSDNVPDNEKPDPESCRYSESQYWSGFVAYGI